MRYRHRSASSQTGFTIVELLIATAVLSTILVLVTGMMIGIGKLYYKGISLARVQSDVRGITEEVSQHLQLNGKPPLSLAPAARVNIGGGFVMDAYCIGPTRYSYIINRQLGTDLTKVPPEIRHVLWRDTTPAAGCIAPADLRTNLAGGTELVAPNSRLTAFSIVGTPPTGNSPYTLSVGVAYGDTDLLSFRGIDTICNGRTGDQFCATASLTTTVVQRIIAN